MNRRECLKALAALGASLSLSALAIESASKMDVDAAWLELQSSSHLGLDDHPRIVLLRSEVKGLPVDEEYKNELLHSIELYRDQILDRPECLLHEGWDDLEALQQVTLGDMNERWLQERAPIEAQEREAELAKEYQRVRGLVGEIPKPSWLAKHSKPFALQKDIRCSRNALFGVDIALCAEYLRPFNLIPVCDLSVSSIIVKSSFPCTHPEYLEIFDHIVFTEMATLARIAREDQRVVWVSCGTSFGLPIRDSKDSKISQSLTDGRLYGIVGGSALNGGYAGLTLYEWNSDVWIKGQFGREVEKFKCGEVHGNLNESKRELLGECHSGICALSSIETIRPRPPQQEVIW
jgi:hypothetical protein